MNRRMKDMFLFDDDEIYAEAKRRIEECRKKKSKKLDLSALDLKEIPREIAELQFLEELDITGLDLKKVPGFIGNIVSLKKLSLGFLRQSAHEREKLILPAELGNLRNLRNLSLGYNIPKIPQWVYKLDNLEALSIYNDSIESIPAEIADIKKLSKLRIHCEKITELPKEIGEKLMLTVLDLTCPQLKALPESFENLKSMKDFLFNSCNLTAIPDLICDWTNLEGFELSMDSTFQGPYTKLKNIPRNIGNLKKLKYFGLYFTRITKIPDSLGNCPLEHLAINGDFSIVPETLGNCSKLEILKLFSGKPVSLPDSIGKLSYLKELRIDAPALKVPASFGRLSSLEDLSLLTQKELVLPKSFGGLRALDSLWLDSPQMRKIPDSIGNCGNLKSVYIKSDKLAVVPDSFCRLKKLEGLHLDTFALEALPSAFGNLSSLKSLEIFSGALTAFPESMGGLKKLVRLSLDAHNVKELPDSFKKLSYVKYTQIEIGQKEPVLAQKKDTVKKRSMLKKRGMVNFEELSTLSYQYRWKLFKTYSIKQLETLLCSAPRYYAATEKDKELFRDIMCERYCRIKRKFKWTEENKKRIAKVSDEFLKAWEDGFTRAKLIIEALYEKEKDKKSFRDKYLVIITLYPDVLFDFNDNDSETSDWKLYDIIIDYLNPEVELNMRVNYDLVTKNEDSFRKNININRDLSWNIEGFGDIDLEGYYICYALHILYSHNNWAFSDIPRINRISAKIKVSCDGENF